MQTARELNPQVNTPMNDSQHSARLEKILLDQPYKKSDAMKSRLSNQKQT